MRCLKRLYAAVIIATLMLSILIVSHFTLTQYHRVTTPRDIREAAPSSSQSTFDHPGDQVRYYQLLESYHKALAAIPKRQYNPQTDYIVKGPPLSSVLKEKGSGDIKTVKRILAWTPFFGNRNYIPRTICEGDKQTCVSVTDRSELANVDGIVIHPIDLKGREDLPSKLLPHQRLIYLLQESPFAKKINVGDYNGVFNWTSMHRRDSDSPYPYLAPSVKRKPMPDEEFTKTLNTIMATKQKLVAFVASNCRTAHSRRLQFIKEVKKAIPVDVYGRCGNLICRRFTEKCRLTMSQYKFYFSMENANCRDYITEKVLDPLTDWRAVPIVMGGADPSDYEYRLPPNSYIHTAGFPNVTELAEYLQILDRNPQLYLQYHAWRNTHEPGYSDYWCYMCRQLHNTSLPIQYYKNFKGWYEEDVC